MIWSTGVSTNHLGSIINIAWIYANYVCVFVLSDSFIFFMTGIKQERFISDMIFWQEQVSHYYRLMNVNKTDIRNVMDMNAFIGGFSVALNTFPVWVMNVVPASMNNTLSAIYDRGLIGAFHDW